MTIEKDEGVSNESGKTLLPCPFCGASPISHAIEPHKHTVAFGGFTMPDHAGSHVIECARCECGMIGATQEEVATAWNLRTPAQEAGDVAGLTREEVEALEAGAHWTTERGRFSTELADGMEKSSLAIDAAGAAEVTAYVGKLRAEALMHNTHATLRALASRASTVPEAGAAGRWVPWKPGDALPAAGEYLVTMQDTETHVDGRQFVSTWTSLWRPSAWVHSPERRAIAYWSIPLPPPYSAMQEPKRE